MIKDYNSGGSTHKVIVTFLNGVQQKFYTDDETSMKYLFNTILKTNEPISNGVETWYITRAEILSVYMGPLDV